mgnify:CR=1 FL=1
MLLLDLYSWTRAEARPCRDCLRARDDYFRTGRARQRTPRSTGQERPGREFRPDWNCLCCCGSPQLCELDGGDLAARQEGRGTVGVDRRGHKELRQKLPCTQSLNCTANTWYLVSVRVRDLGEQALPVVDRRQRLLEVEHRRPGRDNAKGLVQRASWDRKVVRAEEVGHSVGRRHRVAVEEGRRHHVVRGEETRGEAVGWGIRNVWARRLGRVSDKRGSVRSGGRVDLLRDLAEDRCHREFRQRAVSTRLAREEEMVDDADGLQRHLEDPGCRVSLLDAPNEESAHTEHEVPLVAGYVSRPAGLLLA